MRSNSRLNFIIKAVLVIALVVALGYQVFGDKDAGELWRNFKSNLDPAHAWIIVLIVALMPVNWILEASKWRILMRAAMKMSLGRSIRGVLGGLTLSLLTPNRIGEYGGRILFVPSQYNWRAVLATLVGSFAQNLVVLGAGLVAAVFIIAESAVLPSYFNKGIWILILAICLIAFFLYFRLELFSRIASAITPPKWMRSFWENLEFFEKINQRDLTLALLISFIRYIVFGTQFVLMLWFCGVEVPILWLVAGVLLMYLIQTSIPLPPFVDVMAKTEVGIVLWAAFGVNELSVLTASFLIWIINLLTPAFFGVLLIGSVNVLRSLGYEKKSQKSDPADRLAGSFDSHAAVDGNRTR